MAVVGLASALAEARYVYEHRSFSARRWKQSGRRVVGYFEIYTPEELIWAAGILPVRVLGSGEYPSLSDVYTKNYACGHCRSELNEGLRGEYDFMDGLVSPDTCDASQRFFNIWQAHVPNLATFQLGLPKLVDDQGVNFFKWHLSRLRDWLAAQFKADVSDMELAKSIEVHNRSRRALRELYELRASDPPLVSGGEAIAAVVSSMVMPKDDGIGLINRIREEVTARGAADTKRPRLMIVGSPTYLPEYFDLIERAGAAVVADDMSTGSRYFWDDVDTSETDLLRALAKRYLAIPSSYVFNDERFQYTKRMIKKFNVQGVIYHTLKWCTPYMGDYPMYKDLFRELGIPHIRMEDEQIAGSVDKLTPQVEALVDLLK